jgi:amino acid adenylation domain-containing protein
MPTAAISEPMKPATGAQNQAPAIADDGGVLAFPASVAQQMFWYLELLQGEVTAFNVPLRFKLDGPLDPSLLERTLNAIIERHESLRTTFAEDRGELLQIISPEMSLALKVIDISHMPAERAGEEADRLGTIEARRGFKLSTGPLIRAELVRLSKDSHILHVSVHHALFDGMSMTVLTREIAAIYQAYSEGKPCPLDPLPIQYGDYSVWQKESLEGPEMKQQLAYWKTRLDGMTELDLPTDFPRPPVKSWKGEIISTLLPKELTDRLHAIASGTGCTLFHLQFAAYMILLRRYTGALDVAVGTPVTGRTSGELEPLIGVFINSLILRCDLAGNPELSSFVAQVRETALAALENQDLPFECLVRELRPERDQSRNPLFQINFNHHRSFAQSGTFGGVTLTPIPSRSPGTIFDLHFFMVERKEGWRASCDYSTDLFTRRSAERMLGHFKRLLEDIAENPGKRIEDFAILTDEERRELLGDWSGRRREYPRDASIGGLFAETARRFPERTAIESGDERFTYRQLHANATRVAAMLLDAGLKPGDAVAISCRPGPEMIAGHAGILMAGGCCVPLDPAYPAERFALLLDECGAGIGLFANHCDGAFPDGWRERIHRIPALSVSAEAVTMPDVAVTAEHPAHLLFTSGSTGQPKGVLLAHRGTVRLVRNNDFIRIDETEVFLQAAPTSFDASLLEIWGALLNGGKLILLPDGPNLESISSAVRDKGVTTLWLTSGLFQLMIDEHAASLKGLRHLLAGGDVLSPAHVRKALDSLPATRLINGYGPTENTTFTTCHAITPADLERPSIPIGKPITNTRVFILDELLRPVPAGIPGELLTGGDGLALGYRNAPALTAERFIEHPEHGRLYRTGDRCRWNADGTIEFLGRRDHQVKVRGFRIELGEIEALLSSHPKVRQCKAAVRGESAETKRILAWVMPADGADLAVSDLTSHLAGKLPPFMCPDAIGIVGAFPLNANGKIDLRSLPDPGHAESLKEVAYEPPHSGVETRLAAVWSELLGAPQVGRHDDFFALGGHSLMALRLFSRINREFGTSLPLATLLRHPTLAGLASLFDDKTEAHVSKPVAKPLPGTNDDSAGHVVTLAEGAGEIPLFVIHGGDGGVLFYKSLTERMPASLPIHAIESLELGRSGPVRERSIEETATDYLAIIRKVRQSGPYRLAGYSFGGVVAHEIACQLNASGQEVSFLGMFDTHNPAAPSRAYNPLERFNVFWQEHGDESLLSRVGLLGDRIGEGLRTRRTIRAEVRAARSAGPAEPYSDLRRVQVREENWRAMQRYRPGRFKGRITLFKSTHANDKVERPADYGWAALAASGLDVISVQGNHLDLFSLENISTLAATLTQALKKSSRVSP